MEAETLEQSFQQLNELALKEYREPLPAIVGREGDSDELRLLRLGRLVGVTLKGPFATSVDLTKPSSLTRAYRAWSLNEADKCEAPNVRSSWEYKALEALRTNPDVIESLGWQPSSVYDLAETAQGERGFWWYIAMACRKYLCRDRKLRSQIEREVEKARRAGVDLKHVTPELIVTYGGVAIGVALVQSIPVLGIMGAPVIACLVLILYSVGVDGFCSWAKDHASYHANFPNADQDK
jgi:hypothetical protein